MKPKTLDHIALWVADRDPIADVLTSRLGLRVIDRTDTFTLLGGADARRGKLTLFDADGPRERGALKRIGFRVPGGAGETVDAGEGLEVTLVDGAEHDLDHVALVVRDPKRAEEELQRFGLRPVEQNGTRRLEVGGAFVDLYPGEPGNPERPLLNHIGLLVDSADEHIEEARELGVEIDDVVDAPNTKAVFVYGPERVRLEYVEHKPGFSL